MLVASAAFLVLLLIEIDWARGFCKSYDEKSAVGIEQEYVDDYDEVACCETVYPVLYNYIKCINATITMGQELTVDSGANTAKYIKFEHSKIPLVPIGVFSDLTNLSQLYLNNSSVENIHPGAFTGLANLEDLKLQNNNICDIIRGTFNSLTNLKLLDLSDNNLEIIEQHAFLGLFNLQNITLSHNKLKNMFADTFLHLNRLENVDLSHNHLLEISPKLFFNLTKLHQLNLSLNNLTDFDFIFLPYSLKKLELASNQINSLENWSDMPNLQEINLSNNRLTNIETVHGNLKYLNLSGNRIFAINPHLSNNAGELITLDLSHNLISNNLTQDSFVGSFNLKNLYLQNNRLGSIPVGCFRNLKFLNLLNLSNNQIVEFEFGTFSGLATLETLDISYNKLSYLYESSLHPLKSLKYLNIDDNFITSFDPFDLLEHIPGLKHIWINNNPWNCKSLLKIVKSFEKANVSVSQGSTQKSENVHGISCLNYNFNNVTSVLNSNSSINETLIELLQNISKELKELQSFFKKDLQKASFHSVFLKYFEDGFRNTTFYQYLNQDISNVTFFKSFNQTLLSLFKGFQLLDTNFQNSSLYEFVKNAKFAHFKDIFKNKSFENASEVYQLLLKYFENASEVYQLLLKYFENGSKTPNCSNVFNMPEQQNNLQQSTLYTNNNITYYNKDAFSKLYELQSVNIIDNNLMIVVVTVLLIIMVLLIFSQIKSCFNRSNFKNAATRERNGSQSNDVVELV